MLGDYYWALLVNFMNSRINLKKAFDNSSPNYWIVSNYLMVIFKKIQLKIEKGKVLI